MKRQLIITAAAFCAVLAAVTAFADFVNNSELVIGTGANVRVAGEFTNQASGIVTLDGDLLLEGDYTNAAAEPFTSTTGNGEMVFMGSAGQELGGAAAIPVGTLAIDNAAGMTITQDVNIASCLALDNGVITLDGGDLFLGAGAIVAGAPSASAMVYPKTGSMAREFTAAGGFTYPVGDLEGATPGANYSPITLDFTSGTFNPDAGAGVTVTNQKHPDNTSNANYLKRYWTVNSQNIAAFACEVTACYDAGDMVGDPGVQEVMKWDGMAPWTIPAAASINDVAKTISGTVNSFSDFTTPGRGFTGRVE